jgi:hypothetical protein
VALGPQISESLIVRTWGGGGGGAGPHFTKVHRSALGRGGQRTGRGIPGRAGPLGSVRTSLHRYLCLFLFVVVVIIIIIIYFFCLLLLLKVLTAFSLRSGLCVRPPSPLSFFFFLYVCLFKKRKREKWVLVTNWLGLSFLSIHIPSRQN